MNDFERDWFDIARYEDHAKEYGSFDKCQCETCKKVRSKDGAIAP